MFESKVEPSTVSVAHTAKVAFNSKRSNLIDSNVALHMHLTLELSSAHALLHPWASGVMTKYSK